MRKRIIDMDTARGYSVPTRHIQYAAASAPHWAGGFGRPCQLGAEVMRRQAHSFFYALRFMAGGVLGGFRACRDLAPVDQPGTSSAALSLVASVGGFNHQLGVIK